MEQVAVGSEVGSMGKLTWPSEKVWEGMGERCVAHDGGA
jgi:hypothetical protein